MQKKVIYSLFLSLILFILSAYVAEIINFVYVVPFSLPFLLFLMSTETELHQTTFLFFVPFVFGLISDLVIIRHFFALCLIFPIVSWFISYLVKFLKIRKTPIFVLLSFAYGIFLYSLNIPVWVSFFASLVGFLGWLISSLIISKMPIGKLDGEA